MEFLEIRFVFVPGCSSFVIFQFYEPVKFSYRSRIAINDAKRGEFYYKKKEMVLHIYHLLCLYPKFLIPWKCFETDSEGLFGLDRTESWTLGPSRVVSVQYNTG